MASRFQKLFHLVSHAPGKRTRLTLWVRLSALGLGAFLVAMVLTMEWTSRAEFCVTCHYMQSFHDSWAASKHNKVNCIKCHFEPGVAGTLRGKFQGLFQVFSYVTSFYKKSKPWAEVSDATCLQSGCHENQDENKSITFKNIRFSHKNHLQDIRRVAKLRCTSCHSQMVQGAHITVTGGTCFTCHFKAGTSTRFAQDSLAACTRCHTPELIVRATNPNTRYDHAVVVESRIECHTCHGDVVQGQGDVPQQSCMQCHFETERLLKFKDVRFVHETHITEHKIECQNCHVLIQHKLQRLNPSAPPDCNGCHPKTHMEQKILFAGHGGNTRLDAPSKMYQSGLDCKGCHVLHGMVNGFNVTRAGGAACESCHGPGFDRILNTWKQYSATKLAEIEGIYRTASAVARGARPKNDTLHGISEKLLADAGENIRIVRVGKGVHNLTYATQLLSSTYELLQSAYDTLHIRSKLPVFSLNTKSVTPSECGSCHQRMEDHAPTPAFGTEFPHADHLKIAKLTCDNCHTNQPKHGMLHINKESCTNCHHQSKTVATNDLCRTCHTTQFMMFEGKVAGMDADPMKEADVKCLDCHGATERVVTRDVGPKCEKCHTAEYPASIRSYRSEVSNLTIELRNLADQVNGAEEAKRLVALVLKDGSGGAHNYNGITGLLRRWTTCRRRRSQGTRYQAGGAGRMWGTCARSSVPQRGIRRQPQRSSRCYRTNWRFTPRVSSIPLKAVSNLEVGTGADVGARSVWGTVKMPPIAGDQR
jgi:hypothetical protein